MNYTFFTNMTELAWTPFGLIYLLGAMVLGALFGLVFRAILKRIAHRTSNRARVHNIGTPDRALRVIIGVILLAWGVVGDWSLVAFFWAGFAFFESIFSWCGFYAALGKNTCPIN